MKHTLKILIVLVIFSSLEVLSQTPAPMTGEKKRIEHVVVRFGDAWALNDIPTLEGLLSDDYVHTDLFGRVQNRAQWLDYMKDRKAKNITNRISFDDVQIRIYDNTAVVTGRNIIKGPLIGGEASTEIRFTQVLRRKRGDWIRTGFQATAVAPTVGR